MPGQGPFCRGRVGHRGDGLEQPAPTRFFGEGDETVKKHTNKHLTPRQHRHVRVRKKISGSAERPRLVVFRSLKHISGQLVDDVTGRTLCAVTSNRKQFGASGGNCKGAELLGAQLAEAALAKGISAVVFDRGGYLYHGRVKSLAEAARKAGLKF